MFKFIKFCIYWIIDVSFFYLDDDVFYVKTYKKIDDIIFDFKSRDKITYFDFIEVTQQCIWFNDLYATMGFVPYKNNFGLSFGQRRHKKSFDEASTKLVSLFISFLYIFSKYDYLNDNATVVERQVKHIFYSLKRMEEAGFVIEIPKDLSDNLTIIRLTYG